MARQSWNSCQFLSSGSDGWVVVFFWVGGGSTVRILLELRLGAPSRVMLLMLQKSVRAAVDIESGTLLLGFCISQPVQGFLPSTVWKRSCGSSTKKKSERTGRNGGSWKVPLVPASTQLPTVTLSLTRSLLVQGDWCFFQHLFIGTWYLLILISKSFRMYTGVFQKYFKF